MRRRLRRLVVDRKSHRRGPSPAMDRSSSMPRGDRRTGVVEPRHFNHPSTGMPLPSISKAPSRVARDDDDAPDGAVGVTGVDTYFLATTLALLQCRIVEERQAHRPLDLQCPVGAKKDHGGMGVDPLAALGRTEAGTVEKMECLPLQVCLGYGGVGRSNGHGCSTAAPVICPARSLARTSFASHNGNTPVCVLMPAWAATLKNRSRRRASGWRPKAAAAPPRGCGKGTRECPTCECRRRPRVRPSARRATPAERDRPPARR